VSQSARRVSLEPAFLLHHYPWRDTSRILELLTRAHGRVAVIARASRRANSAVGGALQLFGEILISWSGRGEMGQLTGAESVRPLARLSGDRLMSGFYANELVVKLLPRNDPHPALFDAYATLLTRLHEAAEEPARALRIFEKRLLEELGWGLNLEHEAASGEPLDPRRSYRYGLDGGAEPIDGVAEGTLIFCGASLLSLARHELADPRSLADARRLLRAAVDRCLDGRPLRTREVLLEMRAHAGKAEGG
jgi:DNA repair protein RecO (recombination protein O)